MNQDDALNAPLAKRDNAEARAELAVERARQTVEAEYLVDDAIMRATVATDRRKLDGVGRWVWDALIDHAPVGSHFAALTMTEYAAIRREVRSDMRGSAFFELAAEVAADAAGGYDL